LVERDGDDYQVKEPMPQDGDDFLVTEEEPQQEKEQNWNAVVVEVTADNVIKVRNIKNLPEQQQHKKQEPAEEETIKEASKIESDIRLKPAQQPKLESAIEIETFEGSNIDQKSYNDNFQTMNKAAERIQRVFKKWKQRRRLRPKRLNLNIFQEIEEQDKHDFAYCHICKIKLAAPDNETKLVHLQTEAHQANFSNFSSCKKCYDELLGLLPKLNHLHSIYLDILRKTKSDDEGRFSKINFSGVLLEIDYDNALDQFQELEEILHELDPKNLKKIVTSDNPIWDVTVLKQLYLNGTGLLPGTLNVEDMY